MNPTDVPTNLVIDALTGLPEGTADETTIRKILATVLPRAEVQLMAHYEDSMRDGIAAELAVWCAENRQWAVPLDIAMRIVRKKPQP